MLDPNICARLRDRSSAGDILAKAFPWLGERKPRRLRGRPSGADAIRNGAIFDGVEALRGVGIGLRAALRAVTDNINHLGYEGVRSAYDAERERRKRISGLPGVTPERLQEAIAKEAKRQERMTRVLRDLFTH